MGTLYNVHAEFFDIHICCFDDKQIVPSAIKDISHQELFIISELKESISRMGSDLKNKMMSYFKTTWKTINDFALAHKNTPQAAALEQEMNTVMSQMPDMEDEATETACKFILLWDYRIM